MNKAIPIPLTGGYVAIIDAADWSLVEPYSWHAHHSANLIYARTDFPGKPRKQVYMHRLILGARLGQVVDHIDDNGLNNRRMNIRLCSQTENIRRQRLRKDSRTRIKGVGITRDGKYWGHIGKQGRIYYLGRFNTPQEAGKAYDAAALRLFGSFARTNRELGLR